MEVDTPIGKLGIKINNGKLTNITLVPSSFAFGYAVIRNPTPLKKGEDIFVREQLEKYFKNPKHKFNLPLDPQGTEFQKRVWQALCEIPSGTTKTYGELAKELNTDPRAIGNACRRNPIPIVIPCHRVVAKNSLGGFGGEQEGKLMEIKKWLLNHEA
jgi:methylated-DNA-[protein]-cysteine S-methyltransferase